MGGEGVWWVMMGRGRGRGAVEGELLLSRTQTGQLQRVEVALESRFGPSLHNPSSNQIHKS